MATTVIRGDKGYGPHSFNGANLYDARGATVRVNNDPKVSGKETGFRVTGSPANAVWWGGEITSDNRVSEQEWTYVHSKDGPGLKLERSPGITVRGLKMTATFDGINVSDCTGNLLIDTCWLKHVIDDQIEADSRRYTTLRLTNTYIEEGSGQNISSRRGADAVGEIPRVTFEIVSNLIEHKPLFLDSREKNIYAWAPDPTRPQKPVLNCGMPWKLESAGKYDTVLLKDNIFRIWSLFNSGLAAHRLVPEAWTVKSGSGGNLLVWKGPQTKAGNGGVEVVAVPKRGGGTLNVPQSLLGDGEARERTLSLFDFTDDDAPWRSAVDHWQKVTWPAALGEEPGNGNGGGNGNGNGEPPTVDCTAQIAAAVAPLQAQIDDLQAQLAACAVSREQYQDALRKIQTVATEALS